jgi:hypothetical protein
MTNAPLPVVCRPRDRPTSRRRAAKSPCADLSTINVVRSEITGRMATAGAVILASWLDGDQDYVEQAQSHADLACLVFAAMRRAQAEDQHGLSEQRS